MDCFLRFKEKTSAKTFRSNFKTELKKKSAAALALMLIVILGSILTSIVEYQAKTVTWYVTMSVRLLVGILGALAVRCVQRRSDRIQKKGKLVNNIADLIVFGTCCFAVLLIFDSEENGTSGFGYTYYGWCVAWEINSAYTLISNWPLRMLGSSFYFIVFTWYSATKEQLSFTLLINAVESYLMYVTVVYIGEKHQRMGFLEKCKIDQHLQAVIKVLDDTTEGVLIINTKNDVIYQNKTAKNILKTEANLGQSLFSQFRIKSIIPQLESGQEDTPLDVLTKIKTLLFGDFETAASFENSKCSSGEKSFSVEGTISSENSATPRNYLLKFIASFYDKPVIVVNISDTTDRDALLYLQDNSNYKSRLLASVSHELRTPLNASLNFGELALEDPTVPKAAKNKYILPAIRSNRLLLSLVNDILDFSQMQANKLRLVFQSKNILQTAKESIELLEIQAKKKGIQLHLDSQLEPGKEIIFTDHNRLKQIILNLLSNAVKFTFDGAITLKICEAHEENFLCENLESPDCDKDLRLPNIQISRLINPINSPKPKED